MIGVSYDLFWNLNPKSLAPFIKAFELKKQYDDSVAWLHGTYIQMAIGSTMSNKVKYPPKPRSSNAIQKPTEMSSEEIKEKMFQQMNILNSRF